VNERPVQNFLQAFRRVSRQIGLYPEDHPLTEEALEGARIALASMAEVSSELVLALRDDAFYLDGILLPHTSLEFNALLQEMRQRDIRVVTFLLPASPADLFDLAAFVACNSDDLPAEGSIRLNDNTAGDGGEDMSPLRRSYAGSLHVLRSTSDSMAREGAFDLSSVMSSVESLVDTSLEFSRAALLLSTVKSHDEYTFYHSVNTCILTLSLGKLIGLDSEELLPIGVGALLHDIGKTAISTRILNHPGQLPPDYWQQVEAHPQEGAQAIFAAAGPGHEIAATVALEHHSRFDGTGYPHVNVRRVPNLFSSMVAVVDVYDALTTRRRYRRAETPNRALQTLLGDAGTSHHPDMIRAFIQLMGIYPPGSILRRSSGEVVVVTGSNGGQTQLKGVIAIDSSGSKVEPEPVVIHTEDVVEQLLPDRCGIDPASLLETAGVAAQLGDEGDRSGDPGLFGG
jgi:HD-GYP domain-containing protein (c-di-GMP phosphodiesterase class II)